MSASSFPRSPFVALCLAASMGCFSYGNYKGNVDDHPVFNTGVGATILYPGQSPAMPPTHPSQQLPGGAPASGQPGAPGAYGQPAPVPSGTIGGAPTSTVHQGPGSSASSSGGGGVTFIGGGDVDRDIHREVRSEPKWYKYMAAPFAIAAYPFVALGNALKGNDGPPPSRTTPEPTTPSASAPPPVDVQTAYEQNQLEALERELAGQAGSQPPVIGTPPPSEPTPPSPGRERLAPTGDSIAAELAALQRGIPPRMPGADDTPERARSTENEAQPSEVHEPARSAGSEPPPSATAHRGGIADQVTDRNRDGRPDHWVYRQDGQTVRELFDENADGAPDRYVYYESGTGQKSREEEDTDLDGRIDSWLEYQNDKIARHRRDTNSDGFLDTWSFYRDGELTRQERDLDADGFRDRVGFYQNGRLVREEEDRNGDGRPDRVTFFDEQERIRQRDEDRNGDGIVDLRSFYSEGRLIRRELVEEVSDERIEEEDLASSAWTTGDEVQ